MLSGDINKRDNIKAPLDGGQACGRAGIHSLDCTLTLPGGDKHCGFVAVFITILLWVSAVLAGKSRKGA